MSEKPRYPDESEVKVERTSFSISILVLSTLAIWSFYCYVTGFSDILNS